MQLLGGLSLGMTAEIDLLCSTSLHALIINDNIMNDKALFESNRQVKFIKLGCGSVFYFMKSTVTT